jgi:hypothetical protein
MICVGVHMENVPNIFRFPCKEVQFISGVCRRGGPISKHVSCLGTNKNMVMDPDWARNKEWLCWRRPAANYCSGVYQCSQFMGPDVNSA